MVSVKHKIVSSFPCNNGTAFAIITEDYGMLTTTNKEAYDKAVKDGYLELEHEDDYSKETVL